MAAQDGGLSVPVWLIGTEESGFSGDVAASMPTEGFTAERLAQLRDGLADLMDTPLVSLEAYPLPIENTIKGGRLLDAASPLATCLTNLIQHSSSSLKAASPGVTQGGETLYRMVVPAGIATQMGSGLARAMPSAAAATGIHSGILGRAGIVGQATFVPVAPRIGVGATAAGGAATATGAVALATVAAPLVLLAIGAAMTIYAEEQRRRALERITELLQELKQAHLDDQRDSLKASSRAIDRAAAVVLDKGAIGHSLGLDSAVHAVDTAVEAAVRRVAQWQRTLDTFGAPGLTISQLKKAYPGIDKVEGEFCAEIRLAAFAIAAKRRVAALQSVEHAQREPDLTFTRFASVLRSEQETVDRLEQDLATFLNCLMRIQIRPPAGVIDKVLTRNQVRQLLKWPTRLRKLAESEMPANSGPDSDLEISMIRQADGNLRVLALTAAA